MAINVFSFVLLAAVFLINLFPGDIYAANISEPILRLNTDMHTASIRRVDVDKAGKILVTVSDDKTLRVWGLPQLDLLHIIRPPIGRQIEGQLLAVALSPDGRYVATGGWTGSKSENDPYKSIYIFDTQSGGMVRRLNNLPNVITALAFSPDGKRIAGLLGGSNGLRVWNAESGELIDGDLEYGAPSYGLAFSPSGRLATTSDDGFIRLYDVNLNLETAVRIAEGQEPYGVAFSPDGKKLAVGYANSSDVNVLSGTSLKRLYSPNTDNVQGDLSSVAWSSNGEILYAAGRFIAKTTENTKLLRVRKWADEGEGRARDIGVSHSMATIMDLAALPSGGVVFVSADPVVGVVDTEHDKILSSDVSTYRGESNRLFLSKTGEGVFIRDTEGGSGMLFDLSQQRLQRLNVLPDGFYPQTLNTKLEGWRNGYAPRLEGKSLKLEPQEISRSHAFHNDTQHTLLGTEWFVRVYDDNANLLWQRSVNGVVWQVNISSNGRVGVVALNDGTIRWFRMTDGKPLLNLFVHKDGKRWVNWTPEGFFDHSAQGESLIGYHLNQGVDKEAEFIPLSRLYDVYYRPDLVQMKFLDQFDDQITEALKKVGNTHKVFAQGLAPKVRLNARRLKNGQVVVTVDLEQQGGGYGKVVYQVDGVTLHINRPKSNKAELTLTTTLDPGQGKHQLNVIAFNAKNTIESVAVKLQIKALEDKKPTVSRLFLLAVGVDEYQGGLFSPLQYAKTDAMKIVKAFQEQSKKQYDEVKVMPLYQEKASLERINQAFNQLAGELKSQDVFVLYLAGHGVAVDGRFHFFPWKKNYKGGLKDSLKFSLSQDQLQLYLARIPALKSLVILDSCYSGSFNSAIDRQLKNESANGRLSRATGRAVLSATASNEEAIEGFRGMGVFTYALVEGLMGGAETSQDQLISTSELAHYTQAEVTKITKVVWQQSQTPSFVLKGPDFILANIERR